MIKHIKTTKISAYDRFKSMALGKDTPSPFGGIRGEVTLTLTNTKTGEVERVSDHNMITNALTKYFENCGFHNRPTVQEASTVIKDLLGGVMLFDTPLTESADTIHAPSGVKMTANGSTMCTGNSTTTTELGTYYPEISIFRENGVCMWHFEWSTSQGNGTIASVALASEHYGYAGEGNTTSGTRHATRADITNLQGTVRSYSGFSGFVFGIDLAASTCYALDVSNAGTDGTGVLRKYRINTTKYNPYGLASEPILISEQTVTIPENMVPWCAEIYGYIDGNWIPLYEDTDANGNLILWNVNTSESSKWGSGFTQYLWTMTPAGVFTETTIANTSGVTLQGLGNAYFDGNYAFFPNYSYVAYPTSLSIDTTTIYCLNRTNGTITAIPNAYGRAWTSVSSYVTNAFRNPRVNAYEAGWCLHHGSGDGRIVTLGNYPCVIDKEGWVYPTNAANTNSTTWLVDGLIRHSGANLYRDGGYIATVFNLDTPVTKTSDKAMVLEYRLTFNEGE